jgi:hypothetical protein
MNFEPPKSLWAGNAPAPDPSRGGSAPGEPRPPAVPRKKPGTGEGTRRAAAKKGRMNFPAVPATIQRTPRTRVLLKLLSNRIGEWIPAPEMAACRLAVLRSTSRNMLGSLESDVGFGEREERGDKSSVRKQMARE